MGTEGILLPVVLSLGPELRRPLQVCEPGSFSGGGGVGGWVQPTQPPCGAEFLEAPQALKNIFGLN